MQGNQNNDLYVICFVEHLKEPSNECDLCGEVVAFFSSFSLRLRDAYLLMWCNIEVAYNAMSIFYNHLASTPAPFWTWRWPDRRAGLRWTCSRWSGCTLLWTGSKVVPWTQAQSGQGWHRNPKRQTWEKIIKNCWAGKHLKSSSLPVHIRKLLVRLALTAMEMQSAKMMTNREEITSFHTCGGNKMP